MVTALLAGFLATSAPAQERPAPRRIDPDRFPDYGFPAGPRASAGPFGRLDIALPTGDRPLGNCTRDMDNTLWIRCLRETANLTDDELDRVGTRIKVGFEARREVGEVLRRAWSRSIDESLARWRSLRDYECQQLGMAEPGAPPELFPARLMCSISRNAARAEELSRRYGLVETQTAISPQPAEASSP